MKTNKLTKKQLKINLPCIAYCAEEFAINKSLANEDNEYLQSSFYQTTKMLIYKFRKPLHLSNLL